MQKTMEGVTRILVEQTADHLEDLLEGKTWD